MAPKKKLPITNQASLIFYTGWTMANQIRTKKKKNCPTTLTVTFQLRLGVKPHNIAQRIPGDLCRVDRTKKNGNRGDKKTTPTMINHAPVMPRGPALPEYLHLHTSSCCCSEVCQIPWTQPFRGTVPVMDEMSRGMPPSGSEWTYSIVGGDFWTMNKWNSRPYLFRGLNQFIELLFCG